MSPKLPGIPGLGGNAARPPKATAKPPALRPTFRSDLNRPALRPTGPRALGLGQARDGVGGPGEPPPSFVTGTTSAVEWILYWASGKFFDSPANIRQPPFIGDLVNWTFQVPENPLHPRELGGSVSDFVYFLGTGIVILRLDTYYFHIAASATQQAKDAELKRQAAQPGVTVRTIYDTQIIGDPTGAQAVAALADVLAGREILDPRRAGTAMQVRNRVTGLVAA